MNLIKKLSQLSLISEQELLLFARTSPYRYKVYEIKKRNSKGTRTIAHPSKELKYLQRLLLLELEKYLKIHKVAFAYKTGYGIKKNALMHLNSSYILKMDFKNFFPSITPDLLFKTFDKYEIILNDNDKLLLSGLLFWKPKRKSSLVLSIGAPTSPLISNYIMNDFDEKVYEMCKKTNIMYTRYADDLTFSTNKKKILFETPSLIQEVLEESTMNIIKINKDKTVFSSKAHNRHVTGVTLTNDNKLSVGREKKRIISSMIHKYSLGILNDDEILKLKGYFSHISHIENDFYDKMVNKYTKDIIDKLQRE